ncbi:MAG: ribonuclease III [bacterium]|nr:ribonuclease III [bacterium]MDD4153581.1 ribonuclease III [bacterium]
MSDNRLERLEGKIEYSFKDNGLLKRAITHSSYAREHADCPGDNERLEFLGDSILGFLVCDILYKEYPDLNEGEMAKIKSYVVSEPALSSYAEELALGDYILLGRSEWNTDGNYRPGLLADTFEALTAALYIDGGLGPAAELTCPFMRRRITLAVTSGDYRDFKTVLQEIIQEHRRITPTYTILSAYGPEHDKSFVAAVYADKELLGAGKGKSKKAAEQDAAKNALEKLR